MSSSDRRRRVLVVDDSAFMRRLITDIVSSTAEFEVVGTARNGHEALRKVHELDPDIVTMDVEMPGLNGLDALGYIMSETPRPVVMLSAHTTDGGALTLRALDFGAVDVVPKPSGTISLDLAKITERLLQALRAASTANLSNIRVQVPRIFGAPPERGAPRDRGDSAQVVVVIAASTGGPRALAELMPRIQAPLGAAVLVVQHMPPGFTRSLAERLDGLTTLPVAEAQEGEPLLADRILVAPGDRHMRVIADEDGVRITLDRDPTLWGVRPAADHLFRSAGQTYPYAAVGVVLTGMGRDGADGLAAIVRSGGRGIVQDRATSVIWGMPQAAASYAHSVLPLAEIADAIHAEVGLLRRAAAGARRD
jgi:two-component system, chemotaxis family, protein-glutamate methylesterase/glutaminase